MLRCSPFQLRLNPGFDVFDATEGAEQRGTPAVARRVSPFGFNASNFCDLCHSIPVKFVAEFSLVQMVATSQIVHPNCAHQPRTRTPLLRLQSPCRGG